MSHNVGVIVTDDIYSYNRWDLPKKQGHKTKNQRPNYYVFRLK